MRFPRFHEAWQAHRFNTTRWSLVKQALAEGEPGGAQALAELCELYWYPIYSYIRSQGRSSHDAEDLTQGFFARLLERKFLASADHEKGRLRAFLLTCVKRYLSDDFDRGRALKRGKGQMVSFDAELAEQRFTSEAVDELSPDRLFQRRWALTLLDATVRLLSEQYRKEEKAELFEVLRPFLGFSRSCATGYQEVSQRLKMNENTVKSHVHRMRERWRELLLEQVAATLDDPTSDNIKAELGELIGWV